MMFILEHVEPAPEEPRVPTRVYPGGDPGADLARRERGSGGEERLELQPTERPHSRGVRQGETPM